MPASSFSSTGVRSIPSPAPPPREKSKFNSLVIVRATYQGWCQVLCPNATGQCIHALDKPEKSKEPRNGRVHILERDQHDFKSQQGQNSCEKSRVVILGRRGVREIGAEWWQYSPTDLGSGNMDVFNLCKFIDLYTYLLLWAFISSPWWGRGWGGYLDPIELS